LLNEIVLGQVGRVVVTNKDQLLRWGSELVMTVCEAKKVELVILNVEDGVADPDDLEYAVWELVAFYAARLYGARVGRQQRLMAQLLRAVANELSLTGAGLPALNENVPAASTSSRTEHKNSTRDVPAPTD
jgi:predicted site-specific integrase-resolvase